MIRLPFERAYLVESKTCARCNGTGHFALGKPCHDCGQVGRRFTPAGIGVILSVCELLAIADPIDEHRRRWKALPHLPVQAKDARPGMQLRQDPASPYSLFKEWGVVASNQPYGFTRMLRFTDGQVFTFSPEALLERKLTGDELARAEALMASQLGTGAVAAPAST